jgi:MFS family permease
MKLTPPDYGPSLYASLGFDSVTQLIIQGGWITVCPVGNFINSLIVDKVGRTRLLMAGFVGTILALIGECVSLSYYNKTGSHAATSAAVFFLFLHIGFFSVTCDATSYIYASEIFPTPVRAKGLAISVSGLFVATIVFLEAAPTAFAAIGWKYFTLFIAITTLSFFFVWLYCPEVCTLLCPWKFHLLLTSSRQASVRLNLSPSYSVTPSSLPISSLSLK